MYFYFQVFERRCQFLHLRSQRPKIPTWSEATSCRLTTSWASELRHSRSSDSIKCRYCRPNFRNREILYLPHSTNWTSDSFSPHFFVTQCCIYSELTVKLLWRPSYSDKNYLLFEYPGIWKILLKILRKHRITKIFRVTIRCSTC